MQSFLNTFMNNLWALILGGSVFAILCLIAGFSIHIARRHTNISKNDVESISRLVDETRRIFRATKSLKSKFMRELNNQVEGLRGEYPSDNDSLLRLLRYADDMDEIHSGYEHVLESLFKRVKEIVKRHEENNKRIAEAKRLAEKTHKRINEINKYFGNRF